MGELRCANLMWFDLESLMASAIALLSGHEPVQIRSYIWAPLTSGVMLALEPMECGPGSVHEELTQIAISACAVPSRRSLLPVECWREKSPSHAADGRPCSKCVASLATATKAVAVKGPMSGIVRRQWRAGCAWRIASSCSLSYACRSSKASHSSASY